MSLVELVYYLITLGTAIPVLYYVVLSILTLRESEEFSFSSVKNRRFAVVLFAQNGKNTFSRSLYSLSGLVYPKNKYDLYLIAKDESYKSISEAQKLGATVLVPSQGQNISGQNKIIQWAFDQILKSGEAYEALVYFNSDCLVSGNYLEVMNFHLGKGSEIVQSCNKALPHEGGWIEKILQVEFILNNEMKPLARKRMGLDMSIRDNGVCFSTALLKEIPWDISEHRSITNYGLSLQSRGIEIDFAHNAVFFSELEDYLENEYKSRFDFKYLKGKKDYIANFLTKGIKSRSFYHLDRLIDFLMPKLSTLMAFTVFGILFNVIGGFPTAYTLHWVTIFLLGICSVAVTLITANEQEKLMKVFLFVPITFYLKTKILLKKIEDRKVDGSMKENEAPPVLIDES